MPLQRRLADISGPFFDPDKPFRNWSAFPYTQLDLASPPYVDEAGLARGLARARAHLRALHAQGYTGIVIDNLAHLTGFEGPGQPVYPAGSPSRQRAAIYRRAFGELFRDAAGLGMEVFITSDMQWSTPELRAAAGPLRADNPRLAELNRRAVAELLDAAPEVSGLILRVGEAGGAHNQGQAYAGHMIYTEAAALRELIGQILPVCEQRGRLLIVRTWSVGIGELGDLIWSAERYRQVFGAMRSPQLLVSVKHGPADFFRQLPHNPTLGLPGPRQIVELQNRREYELFGMVPSSVAELHGAALARAAADPRCAGIWAWNSTGGWGGGRASLGESGWSLWTELSSALTAALAAEPGRDAAAFVHGWLAREMQDGGGQASETIGQRGFAAALAELYLESAGLIERGWYMGQLPRAERSIAGIYLTPLLWVWWMRPTAALPIWAYLADAVGDVAGALAASEAATARAAEHAARLADLAPAGDGRAAALVDSARYLAAALALALAARRLMLPLMARAGRGERPGPAELRAAAAAALAAIEHHEAAWAGRADLPPLELGELRGFVAELSRRPRRTFARMELTARALRQLRGQGRARLGLAGAAGATAMALLLLARHPRLSLAGAAAVGLALPLRRRALGAALPWLCRRLDLLPSIFFEAGPAVGEWAA